MYKIVNVIDARNIAGKFEYVPCKEEREFYKAKIQFAMDAISSYAILTPVSRDVLLLRQFSLWWGARQHFALRNNRIGQRKP